MIMHVCVVPSQSVFATTYYTHNSRDCFLRLTTTGKHYKHNNTWYYYTDKICHMAVPMKCTSILFVYDMNVLCVVDLTIQ